MKRIEQLLRDAIGLDANSIGSAAVHRAARLRMKARNVRNVDEYLALLATSPTERTELIESVVVAETWFFRDPESFGALVHLVKEEWLPQHPTGVLRILSVPCSSGEEPYSLTMALVEAGLRPERFRIDAADISEQALSRAQRAVYTRNSFRGKDLSFRNRYFYTTKDGFALQSEITGKINFFQGNIVGADFPVRSSYDVVFCRNLLIYFDRATQKKALDQINRLLAPGGLLFVGPAEQPLLGEHGFVALGIPMSFASRKAGLGAATPQFKATPPVKSSAIWVPNPQVFNVSSASSAKSSKPAREANYDLKSIRRLADAGRLEAAAELCQSFLQMDATSAEAWYLCGLIAEARGDTSAIECYRKALYLDPRHYETLLQMALLAEKEGNTTGARAFRNRAEKLKTVHAR